MRHPLTQLVVSAGYSVLESVDAMRDGADAIHQGCLFLSELDNGGILVLNVIRVLAHRLLELAVGGSAGCEIGLSS